MSKKTINFKKEFKEWGIFVAIIAIMYITGLHTEVAAFAQRAVLSTGLMTADTDMESDRKDVIDYNFKIKSMDGEVVELSQFKNKVIFINLWATWCPPCRAEMPSIQSLYDKMKDNEDIVFVMLSLDKAGSEGKINKFIDKKSFDFPVYLPATEVPNVLRSPSIPTTFVVAKNGKIVSKKVGMAKYDTKSFENFLMKQTEE
jgi:thiol-disulfide isomerase/thioredoxin